MRKTRFFALAWFILTAEAAPPRPVHLDIATVQSKEILIACIKHQLAGFPVKEVPLDNGGVSIQFSQLNNIFNRAPMLYWNIVPDDATNHITVLYRHPTSEKTAAKLLRVTGRKCFPYELEAAGGGKLPAPG